LIPLILSIRWRILIYVQQLEELDQIFAAKNPVKYSIETKTLAITENQTVIAIDSHKV
jgi:hypothetical protein